MKKGFTIVEMLMVIGILVVLMGIITTAASQSVQAGRSRRAEALCSAVQSGLAAYYAQKDEWPSPLGGKVRNGISSNVNSSDEEEGEVYGNPLMDISGLFVSRDPGEAGSKGYGMDFMSAIRGTKRSRTKMSTSEMYFGYPDTATGRFRRFKMIYSIPTDQLTVGRQ